MDRTSRALCGMSLCAAVFAASLPAQGQPSGGMTTVCHFTSGPRSGAQVDLAPAGARPVMAGSPCADNNGNKGIAVLNSGAPPGGAQQRPIFGQPGGPPSGPPVSPFGPPGGPGSGATGPGAGPGAGPGTSAGFGGPGTTSGSGGVTTLCRFTNGARAGSVIDFAPYGAQPIPVGSPCQDGGGSYGVAVARTGQVPGSTPGSTPPSTMTTVCQFNNGPRSGTQIDFAPYGVQPIPVGSPCQDGAGSSGIAIAGSGTNTNTTTVCQFNSGGRAGTRFDFAPYGVQPIPVGSPCTDGAGSNGIAVAR